MSAHGSAETTREILRKVAEFFDLDGLKPHHLNRLESEIAAILSDEIWKKAEDVEREKLEKARRVARELESVLS